MRFCQHWYIYIQYIQYYFIQYIQYNNSALCSPRTCTYSTYVHTSDHPISVLCPLSTVLYPHSLICSLDPLLYVLWVTVSLCSVSCSCVHVALLPEVCRLSRQRKRKRCWRTLLPQCVGWVHVGQGKIREGKERKERQISKEKWRVCVCVIIWSEY